MIARILYTLKFYSVSSTHSKRIECVERFWKKIIESLVMTIGCEKTFSRNFSEVRFSPKNSFPKQWLYFVHLKNDAADRRHQTCAGKLISSHSYMKKTLKLIKTFESYYRFNEKENKFSCKFSQIFGPDLVFSFVRCRYSK